MATKARLLQTIDNWVGIIRPIAAADPATFIGFVGATVDNFAQSLRTIAETKSEAFATAFITGNLIGATGRVNDAFGTQVRRILTGPDTGFYTTSGTGPVPTMAAPPLTPQQEQAIGPGVITREQAEAEIQKVAQDQAEAAAAIIAARPVSVDAPAPIQTTAVAPIPTSLAASQAETTGIPMTLAQTAAAAKSAPVQLKTVPLLPDEPTIMALPMIPRSNEPFISSITTGLPTSGGPVAVQASGNGFDPIGGLAGAGGALLGGGSAGDIIKAGLGGLLGTPTAPPPSIATPTGFAPTPGITAQDDPNLLNKLLTILGALPGGQVPAAVIGGAQTLIGNGTQSPGTVQTPLNGATGTFGLPFDPVMLPTMTLKNQAPAGFVIVTLPSTGQKVAMYKPLARSLKLWKARRKPPISASQWKALGTAKRVEAKAKKIAQTAGFKVTNR